MTRTIRVRRIKQFLVRCWPNSRGGPRDILWEKQITESIRKQLSRKVFLIMSHDISYFLDFNRPPLYWTWWSVGISSWCHRSRKVTKKVAAIKIQHKDSCVFQQINQNLLYIFIDQRIFIQFYYYEIIRIIKQFYSLIRPWLQNFLQRILKKSDSRSIFPFLRVFRTVRQGKIGHCIITQSQKILNFSFSSCKWQKASPSTKFPHVQRHNKRWGHWFIWANQIA